MGHLGFLLRRGTFLPTLGVVLFVLHAEAEFRPTLSEEKAAPIIARVDRELHREIEAAVAFTCPSPSQNRTAALSCLIRSAILSQSKALQAWRDMHSNPKMKELVGAIEANQLPNHDVFFATWLEKNSGSIPEPLRSYWVYHRAIQQYERSLKTILGENYCIDTFVSTTTQCKYQCRFSSLSSQGYDCKPRTAWKEGEEGFDFGLLPPGDDPTGMIECQATVPSVETLLNSPWYQQLATNNNPLAQVIRPLLQIRSANGYGNLLRIQPMLALRQTAYATIGTFASTYVDVLPEQCNVFPPLAVYWTLAQRNQAADPSTTERVELLNDTQRVQQLAVDTLHLFSDYLNAQGDRQKELGTEVEARFQTYPFLWGNWVPPAPAASLDTSLAKQLASHPPALMRTIAATNDGKKLKDLIRQGVHAVGESFLRSLGQSCDPQGPYQIGHLVHNERITQGVLDHFPAFDKTQQCLAQKYESAKNAQQVLRAGSGVSACVLFPVLGCAAAAIDGWVSLAQEGSNLAALQRACESAGNVCAQSTLKNIAGGGSSLAIGAVIEAAAPGLKLLSKAAKAAKRYRRLAADGWTTEGEQLLKERAASRSALPAGATFGETATAAATYERQALTAITNDTRNVGTYITSWLTGGPTQSVWHLNLQAMANKQRGNVIEALSEQIGRYRHDIWAATVTLTNTKRGLRFSDIKTAMFYEVTDAIEKRLSTYSTSTRSIMGGFGDLVDKLEKSSSASAQNPITVLLFVSQKKLSKPIDLGAGFASSGEIAIQYLRIIGERLNGKLRILIVGV